MFRNYSETPREWEPSPPPIQPESPFVQAELLAPATVTRPADLARSVVAREVEPITIDFVRVPDIKRQAVLAERRAAVYNAYDDVRTQPAFFGQGEPLGSGDYATSIAFGDHVVTSPHEGDATARMRDIEQRVAVLVKGGKAVDPHLQHIEAASRQDLCVITERIPGKDDREVTADDFLDMSDEVHEAAFDTAEHMQAARLNADTARGNYRVHPHKGIGVLDYSDVATAGHQSLGFKLSGLAVLISQGGALKDHIAYPVEDSEFAAIARDAQDRLPSLQRFYDLARHRYAESDSQTFNEVAGCVFHEATRNHHIATVYADADYIAALRRRNLQARVS